MKDKKNKMRRPRHHKVFKTTLKPKSRIVAHAMELMRTPKLQLNGGTGGCAMCKMK